MTFSSYFFFNVVITFSPDSYSSSGDNPTTLDMNKIPPQLRIPFEQLELQGLLGRVRHFISSARTSQIVPAVVPTPTSL